MNRNKRSNQKRAKTPSQAKMGTKNPPQLETSIQATHRFRFVANGSGSTATITRISLIDLLCVATAANAAYRVIDAFKIKSVELWSANSVASPDANTAEIEWLATDNIGNSSTRNDTAIGVSDIAHVFARPPVGSTASFWNQSSSGSADVSLFRIAIPDGGMVDVVLNIIFSDSDHAIAVTGAVAGATTGKFYCRALDSAAGTATLVPVGWDRI